MTSACVDCNRIIRRGTRCQACAARGFPKSPGRPKGRHGTAGARAGLLQAFAFKCGGCGAAGVDLKIHSEDYGGTESLLPLCSSCHRRAELKLL